MPRILHIGKYYPPFAGGIEHFMADLLSVQQQLGATVAAVVHDHRPQVARLLAKVAPESPLSSTYPAIYRVPSYGRLVYAPISPHFPWWLNRIIRTWQPDIVHIHMPNTSALWLLSSRRARQIPWVVHWHSDVVSATGSLDKRLNRVYPVYRPFEQALLRHSQAIIATSLPYLQTSVALQPWLDKCHVVPLGLAIACLPNTSDPALLTWAEQQWRPNQLRILCVGRLTYYKGQAILLQALAQLPEVQAYVVGTGEQQSVLSELIKDLQLEERVTLAGYCEAPQLHALLQNCDCVCLPSIERTEAFGMVLLEAMHYAKPTIASAVSGSGMTWVVQQGKTGLLVPPKDIVSLQQALKIMYRYPALREQMGRAGAQRFSETFAMLPVAETIHNIYSRLLK